MLLLKWVTSCGTGKCSHGGGFDRTRNTEPTGGINKDEPTAEHGHAHHSAAWLATAATIELLDDIRGAAGNVDFLRYTDCRLFICLPLSQTGNPLLALKVHLRPYTGAWPHHTLPELTLVRRDGGMIDIFTYIYIYLLLAEMIPKSGLYNIYM